MATPGYVDVESTIESKLGDGQIIVEAPPLTTGTPESAVFKRYPVAVLKPIYRPFASDVEAAADDDADPIAALASKLLTLAPGDSTSCISDETAQRLIAWISATSVEVKARQPYDVWPASVMRHTIGDENYYSLLVFAAFENITYADLVDMAAVFKRYEPENLILDDGRYPALDAFIPTTELVTEVFSYAQKMRAATA